MLLAPASGSSFSISFVDGGAVNPRPAGLFHAALHHADEWGVEHAVHEEYIVAFGCSRLDVDILLAGIGGVKMNELVVFVGLKRSDFVFCNQPTEFARRPRCSADRSLLLFHKLLIGDHAVFDKHRNIIPLFLELVGIVAVDFLQFVSHLLVI
ncbi:MAG: hypothetical protein R3B47_18950 [Bacteroidia bacterium]